MAKGLISENKFESTLDPGSRIYGVMNALGSVMASLILALMATQQYGDNFRKFTACTRLKIQLARCINIDRG